ncbi:hypothetical protein ID47_06705 [Candidatus Paracaedibacter acanthamoebae]|uniref:Uncharacterized protein n=1 Tax=Candidatus Odyssella acanthamoebae TaxID=91604 RepID=A0A077AXY7_9PROT|nr:hypothetical protein ID47_06705 [Candidatus Paracaedibacter acanthamoebae]
MERLSSNFLKETSSPDLIPNQVEDRPGVSSSQGPSHAISRSRLFGREKGENGKIVVIQKNLFPGLDPGSRAHKGYRLAPRDPGSSAGKREKMVK